VLQERTSGIGRIEEIDGGISFINFRCGAAGFMHIGVKYTIMKKLKVAMGLSAILWLAIGGGVRADTLFVSNYSDSTIRKVTSDGTVTTFATVPRQPFGIAFDGSGTLYVASAQLTNKISRINSEGVVTPFATLPKAYDATDIAFDNRGILYVGSQGGFGVGRVTRSGTSVPFKGPFTFPLGIAFDRNQNLFVADANNGKITKVQPNGVATTFVSGLGMTWGLAFDETGNLYVAAQNKIRKITPDGTNTVFASGLISPQGLAFDSHGDLFVADAGDDSVKKITPDGSVSKVAGGMANPTYIAVLPDPAPPRLVIEKQQAAEIAQNGARISVFGGINQYYQVLYSTDLVGWSPFGTNQIRANSSAMVMDLAVENTGRRFYRARLLP
jgi:sugar lactone lactonase YvrE